MYSAGHEGHYTKIVQVMGGALLVLVWAGTKTGELDVQMDMGGVKERKRNQGQRARVWRNR